MDILTLIFEILGTIAFSVSGAISAMKKDMDLFGVMILGLTTAVGGGIIRDVLLGSVPPKAFLEYKYALIAVAVAAFTFALSFRKHPRLHTNSFEKLLLYMDSIGLGVFTVVGVQVSQLHYGVSPFLNICMGVLTGVGGGVLRDMFSCQTPYIFTKHFYATASLIGAVVYVILCSWCSPNLAGLLGGGLIILLRLLAAHYRWKLPKPRHQE